MSDTKSRRTKTIWDIEFDKQVPDAKLVAFNQHKETLLAVLREAHGRGCKSEPFDAGQSWRVLSHLAQLYFWDAKIRQKAAPTAVRVKRLRDLAKTLSNARRMIDKANQGDIGHDLFRSCFAITNKSTALARDDNGSFDPGLLTDTIKTVVEGLVTLETAANRAGDDVRARGRPLGTTVLPSHYIIALGDLYHRSTGLKPNTGEPFARLVREFLTAIGQGGNTSVDYVVETIKYARKQARKNPGRVAPNPFDK